MDLREGLKAFAAAISRQPMGLAYHRPEPWAEVRRCFENAEEKVRREGRGMVRFGWAFHHRVAESKGEYLFAMHHAVWNSPEGWLVDVTPFHEDPNHHPITQGGSVLFLVDDAATPVVTDRVTAPLPLRYFALGDDRRLRDYVEELRREEERKCREIYETGVEPPPR